jgi:GMP synthase-like glutamine amidotransferase
MSVNDDLAWIPPALHLIRDAVARDVPVLGHCLGGQLMAKALGGVVGPAPVTEIGWGPVDVIPSPASRAWFGEAERFVAFHWHGETFSIPEGAEKVLAGRWCDNQGFALGPHLALQCHVEMTAEMIRCWCEKGGGEIERSLGSPAVQGAEEIVGGADMWLNDLQGTAARIYATWASRLVGL